MTRSKRGRGDLSPSLFPFLAVLLCTVGALVLMLVLVVGKSQAAVKEAVETKQQRTEELRAQVETIRDSFRETREKIQLEIEKKRMSLQGLEQQTTELAKELEQLSKTAELVEKQESNEQASEEKIAAELNDLQKQLEEAAEKLKNKIAKPKGDKPVFAIIPYEGTNGTHRRPIYLECRQDGIVVQPEGVFIGLKDLRPPYGPGNPLDAALRTVRTHYAPKDGALNSSAYPLLVVRSSGVRTYALARLAMAGWDDQFGYELIEDDMELAFPEGEPSLGKEIERTLAAARNRQAALVMAMPGKYRQAMEELNSENISFEGGEGGWGSGSARELGDGLGDEVGGGSGGASGGDRTTASSIAQGNGTNPSASGGSNPVGPLFDSQGKPISPTANGASGDSSVPGSIPGSSLAGMNGNTIAGGGRAGFAYSPDGTQPGGGPSGARPPINSYGGTGSGGSTLGFATGGDATAGSNNSSSASGATQGWNSYGTKANSAAGNAQSFAQGAFSGNQYTRAGSESNSSSGTNGEGGGQQASSGYSGQTTLNGKAGTFRDAMSAARTKQTGNADAMNGQSQNAANSSAADVGTGGSQYASPRSDGFGSNSSSSSEISSDSMAPAAEVAMNKKNKEKVEAVAKRKGRNWAWSAGPPRETAVVRNIRMVCYEDRWVILPDQGSKDKPQTVMLDVSPQSSAEELAKIIADKVDRWGYALSGGYWKPILQIEVAPRGAQRYDELVRLLEGSGLEIQPAAPSSGAPAVPSASKSSAIKPSATTPSATVPSSTRPIGK